MFLCLPVFSQKSTILNLKSIRIDDFYLICPTTICQEEDVFISWGELTNYFSSSYSRTQWQAGPFFLFGWERHARFWVQSWTQKISWIFQALILLLCWNRERTCVLSHFLKNLVEGNLYLFVCLFSWNMVSQDFPWWLFYQSPYFIECHINSFIYTFCYFMQNRAYGEMAAWWCGNYARSQVQ